MHQLKLILIGIVAICLTEVSFAQTDYCKANLCKDGKKHVACNNNGAFGKQCAKNAKVLQLPNSLRQKIVRKHNLLRSQIAEGKLRGYQPAKRMATMRWSPELAKLAEYNVKQCKMKHDQCRNTNKFAYAGQNGAKNEWSGRNRPVAVIAQEQIQKWFDENKKCSMAIIKNLNSLKTCGHFTSLVQEKNMAVGCAILRQKKNGRTLQLMTCNYAYTNIFDEPVYRDGKTASLCKTGRNPRYKGLCSVKEPYDLKTTKL